MHLTTAPHLPPRLARWLGTWLPWLALAGTFAAMTALTWGTWPDVLVDFGAELYVPWRLTQGQALGRDLALVASGPLSPYLNALVFALFGTGLRTLVLFNLLLLAGLTGLLLVLLREVAGAAAATLACLVFLTVFGFGQYASTGNYNYVTPYAHGTTHGMLLALLSLLLLFRHARSGRLRDLVGMSVSYGLVLLTKPEFAVACGGALAVGAALLLRAAPDRAARRRLLALGLLPALAPALLSLAALAALVGPALAWQVTLAPFLAMASPLARSPFYLSTLGLDDPSGNLALAAGGLAAMAGVLAPVAVLDRLARGPVVSRVVAVAAAALAAGLLARLFPEAALDDLARPWPALLALGAGWTLVGAWRAGRPGQPAAAGPLLHAALSAFALLLLLKMVLNTRLYHYGFVLAMPATLLLVTWLVAAIPAGLARRGGTGRVFQAVGAALVLVLAGMHLRWSDGVLRSKTIPVGQGADAFLADDRGLFVNLILQQLEAQARPGDTLAVLPGSPMLNYLARRVNPSPYLTTKPDALALWGEPTLLSALLAAPPTFVIVLQEDESEHGAAFLGQDYGLATAAWLRRLYREVGAVGGSPWQRGPYGVRLLRLRDEGGATPAAPP